MDLISGQVFLPHETPIESNASHNSTTRLSEAVAYCPQGPWIMNRSIRANILVGQPFDGRRYETVLHAVALVEDLATLDQGDPTLAGENGNRLSGGQKQRVALARAFYSSSKCVLLDDCFSAVDSPTANHIFFHAVKGPLMRGRTCILATHHTQLSIPHCDYVVVLDDGQIKSQGTPKELVSAGVFGADMMEGNTEIPPSYCGHGTGRSEIVMSSHDIPSGLSPVTESLQSDVGIEGPETKLDYKESKAEGAVPWSVVRAYVVAMGSGWYWIIVFMGFAPQQLASLGTNLWIKKWAFQYDKLNRIPKTETIEPGEVAAWYYLTIYTIICISYALITFLRDLVTFYGSLKASSKIYERLLNSILHAKLLFFDRVPLGQITNRFSKDVNVLDQSISTFSVSAFQLIGSIAMVVILISAVLPAFLPVAGIIFLAYYFVMAIYICGARDLKRIEAVERSPLYQQFGETLAGCVSIRAYALISIFTSENYNLIDQLNQPYLLLWATKEWLTFHIDMLSSIISFSTAAFVLRDRNSISPGIAGLVLTYATTFTENVIWLVQIYAIIQQNLNSIERIVEYIEVEQEPATPLRKIDQDLPRN